ncbi:hypothetical protein [Cupriavidus sp. TMH.W2]|uniref:hypothetical protein n=1 Tax=Cupriavidus sp. TMH.W2 TaxID=3434465 RepID=UPI003D773ACC
MTSASDARAPSASKIPAKEVREVLVPKAFHAILLEDAQPPTVDRVTEWLAKQGYSKPNRNVISEGIKACYAVLSERLRQPIFDQLPDETVQLVYALRDHLLKQAKHEFVDETAEIRAQAARDVDVARAAQADAELARHEARKELDIALEVKQAQDTRIDELHTALKAAKDEVERLRGRVDHVEGELEMSRRAVQGLEVAAHAREREHSDALTKLQDQLDAERQRFDADHKRNLLAIERERMETKLAQKTTADALAKIETLNERERDRVAEMAVLKTQLASEQLTRRQLQDAGAKQIADAEQAAAVARDAVGVAQAAEATARGQLQAMNTQLDELRTRLASFGSLSAHSLSDLIVRAMLLGRSVPADPADPAAVQQTAQAAARELLAPFDVRLPDPPRADDGPAAPARPDPAPPAATTGRAPPKRPR